MDGVLAALFASLIIIVILDAAGSSLIRQAVSATAHCLTGCAIGEVLGLIVGTALSWSKLATIVLAVALAFLFGYSLTIGPVLRAGVALAAAIPVALEADTLSITDGDRRQRDHATRPWRHDRRPGQLALLGQPRRVARDRLRAHGVGQPLAPRPRQGPRGGAPVLHAAHSGSGPTGR